MELSHEVSFRTTPDRAERIVSIEEKSGVRVPDFVKKVEPIDSAEAIKISKDFNLGYREDRDWYNQILGIELCRRLETTPEKLYNLPKEIFATPTVSEIVQRLSDRPLPNINERITQEKRIQEARNFDLLKLECDLLKKRGIEVPTFVTLEEYAEWIGEFDGSNSKYREWNGKNYAFQIPHAKAVIWDLLDHYKQFFEGARRSADPLSDWERHFSGVTPLTDFDSWHVQNIGKEDISYYSMRQRWGRGTRTRPNHSSYDDELITHTTSVATAKDILLENKLNGGRNNFSAGRVVASGMKGRYVTFVFPRKLIESTYNLQPYAEPMDYNEREMRAYEPISLDFCIGVVPTVTEIFPDFHGHTTGNDLYGDATIKRWGEYFKTTGKLLSPDEQRKIQEIANKIQIRKPSYV